MGVAQVDTMQHQTASDTKHSSGTSDSSMNATHADQHPQLKRVSIVDCHSMNEIIPNNVPMPIDNECFSGHIMLLVRTPDVDDIKEMKPRGDIPCRVSNYMKSYKRRFEFQFQVKLKKVPTGPLFLGCEVNDPIKVSRFTKGLSNVLLAMIRRINSGFHYSWGIDMKKPSLLDQEAINEGRYEKTHLSFPVEASMDRIVITKPSEKLPDLGYELFETPESVKRRRRMGAGSVDWNLDDTYTMCLWSAYCDWIKWKSMNVPGVRPFSLSAVSGKQPIYLSVYEISNVCPQDYKKKKPPHNRKDLKIYTRLEFCHTEMTEGGIAPRFQKGYREDSSLVETDSEIGSESDMGDSQKRAGRRR
uniref:Domain of unknown function at the cortex 1 domain-containing protein n=1 Tax=Craspedostauros australis TaxID=1486917 RepID=A0A7R9WLV0_9STRA|mmetsp:Transcript_10416/g.28680  ORF Transcript_10416/g.28680 Transcript_10416/m.28680 type:complete len:359 (+) Transcript_10416:852-1928(+)